MRRLGLVVALAAACGSAHAEGESLLVAGRIHTGDPERPVVEAMAWDAQGRVLAVGSAEALSKQFPAAARHEARDATVVPGLVDAHAHLMNLGFALLRAPGPESASAA